MKRKDEIELRRALAAYLRIHRKRKLTFKSAEWRAFCRLHTAMKVASLSSGLSDAGRAFITTTMSEAYSAQIELGQAERRERDVLHGFAALLGVRA